MAKQTVTTETLIDDIDGTTAHRTVRFSYGGTAYEIELSNKNFATLEKTLKPYIGAGRKVRHSAVGKASAPPKRDYTPIREWANSNGFEVSARGRIPQYVIDAYDAAQQ